MEICRHSPSFRFLVNIDALSSLGKYISMGESNSVVSAYKYRHLQQYCSLTHRYVLSESYQFGEHYKLCFRSNPFCSKDVVLIVTYCTFHEHANKMFFTSESDGGIATNRCLIIIPLSFWMVGWLC